MIKRCIAGIAFVTVTQSANAGTIFSNPVNPINGWCNFSTSCQAMIPILGNNYGAQMFTVSTSTNLMSASFVNFMFSINPTEPSAANWLLLDNNGAGGSPGNILFSGNESIVRRVSFGSANPVGIPLIEESFDLPSIALNTGSYYFAIQAVSNDPDTYLANGQLPDGAFETRNGGLTWISGYGGPPAAPSVALSLYDTSVANTPVTIPPITTPVPEPETYAMLLAGLGLLGFAARHRKQSRS